MEKKIDWAKVKPLTKEQQKLAADHEKLIGYVICRLYHFKMNSELYEYCYGFAAFGLCKAAIIFKDCPPNGGTFAGLACKCMWNEVAHAMESIDRYKEVFHPLSLDTPFCPDADDDFELRVPAPDEFEPLESKILVESIYQKLESVLTPLQKEAFHPWLHGKEETKIAKEMEKSIASVRHLICQSKKKCRACFNPDEIFS